MIKTPHDPTRILPPRATVAAVAAVITIAVSVGACPAASMAMKMRHDCCVWTAPTR
jgi:hypothetical protein